MGRVCAIVLAAGKGKRMGANINKQFININEKPVLFHTLRVFQQCEYIDDIVVVCSADEIEYCNTEIVQKYAFSKVIKVVVGGKERQDSVFNGLIVLENCDIVLIHDGARPFIDFKIIKDGIYYANKYGASACGVMPKDTIKIRDNEGFSIETPDRNSLFCVQTPQSFKYEIILETHKKIKNSREVVTDDTMAVEKYGHKVFLYDGSYNNIKITTQEDLIVAEKIFSLI